MTLENYIKENEPQSIPAGSVIIQEKEIVLKEQLKNGDFLISFFINEKELFFIKKKKFNALFNVDETGNPVNSTKFSYYPFDSNKQYEFTQRETFMLSNLDKLIEKREQLAIDVPLYKDKHIASSVAYKNAKKLILYLHNITDMKADLLESYLLQMKID